jgi:hypothetical protein
MLENLKSDKKGIFLRPNAERCPKAHRPTRILKQLKTLELPRRKWLAWAYRSGARHSLE